MTLNLAMARAGEILADRLKRWGICRTVARHTLIVAGHPFAHLSAGPQAVRGTVTLRAGPRIVLGSSKGTTLTRKGSAGLGTLGGISAPNSLRRPQDSQKWQQLADTAGIAVTRRTVHCRTAKKLQHLQAASHLNLTPLFDAQSDVTAPRPKRVVREASARLLAVT